MKKLLVVLGILAIHCSVAAYQNGTKKFHIFASFISERNVLVISEIAQFEFQGKDSLQSSSAFRQVDVSNDRRFKLYIAKNDVIDGAIPSVAKTITIMDNKDSLESYRNDLLLEFEKKTIFVPEFEFIFYKKRNQMANE